LKEAHNRGGIGLNIDFFKEVFSNQHLWLSLLAMVIAQVLKIFLHFFQTKKINLKLLFSTGFMPSSHSSQVACLATTVGMDQGFGSYAFAIAAIFAGIVMYDAAGVRRAAGKQAAILNKMMEDYFSKKQVQNHRLKELLGHTPMQVYGGLLLGVIVGLLFYR